MVLESGISLATAPAWSGISEGAGVLATPEMGDPFEVSDGSGPVATPGLGFEPPKSAFTQSLYTCLPFLARPVGSGLWPNQTPYHRDMKVQISRTAWGPLAILGRSRRKRLPIGALVAPSPLASLKRITGQKWLSTQRRITSLRDIARQSVGVGSLPKAQPTPPDFSCDTGGNGNLKVQPLSRRAAFDLWGLGTLLFGIANRLDVIEDSPGGEPRIGAARYRSLRNLGQRSAKIWVAGLVRTC